MRWTARAYVLLLVAGVLTACSGGGGFTRPGAALPVAQNAARATVTVRLSIPRAASAHKRRAAYISAATRSAVLTSPVLAAAVTFDASSPGGGCTAAAGVTTCSASLDFPVGSTTITVKAYDGAAGTGTLLSTGTMPVTVQLNAANTVTATLDGVLADMSVVMTPPSLTAGTAANATLLVTAYDPDGKAIVGGGNYVDASDSPHPVSVVLTDSSGTTRFADGTTSTQVSGPAAASVAIRYNGGALPNASYAARFAVSVAGMPIARNAALAFAGGAGTLYASTGYLELLAFPSSATGNVPPFRRIRPSLAYPEMLAEDTAGNVYVVDDNGNVPSAGVYEERILVYGPAQNGNPQPLREIAGPHTKLYGPWGIAVDAAGYVYVANRYNSSTPLAHARRRALDAQRGPRAAREPQAGYSYEVEIYAPGADGDVAPVGELVLSGVNNIGSIAFDPGGNLWVGTVAGTSAVWEFSAAQVAAARSAVTTPSPVATVGGSSTMLGNSLYQGLAFDAAGDLYAASGSTPGNILVFDKNDLSAGGNIAPKRLVPTQGYVGGIAVDTQNELIVLTQDRTQIAGAVTVYAAGLNGSNTALRSFTTPNSGSGRCGQGVAADAATITFTDNCSLQLFTFALTAAEPATPSRTITTYQGYPGALWVDGSGYLYVANNAAGGLAVYPPGADGYAAPSRFIYGPSTGFSYVSGATTAADGTLYATVEYTWTSSAVSGQIVVFAPGANGNVAPLRTLTASAVQGRWTGKPAFSPGGELVALATGSNAGIYYFDPAGSGAVTPTRSISGSLTGLGTGSYPGGFAIDANGTVYVGMNSPPKILVFAPPALGANNVAPVRTITPSFIGGAYGYSQDLALDAGGTLYYPLEGWNGTQQVLILPSSANGAVTPQALGNSGTYLTGVYGVAAGP